jgi:hypothetical protein
MWQGKKASNTHVLREDFVMSCAREQVSVSCQIASADLAYSVSDWILIQTFYTHNLSELSK